VNWPATLPSCFEGPAAAVHDKMCGELLFLMLQFSRKQMLWRTAVEDIMEGC
jgi:hypothetical protein